MKDIMKIANSIPMWIACGTAVILVIVQAVIFAKSSYKAGEKIGLTKKQMRGAYQKQRDYFDRAFHRYPEWNAVSSHYSRRPDGLDAPVHDRLSHV